MAKWVYFFGNGQAEGDGTMRELLGGKGANLAEMTRLGIPVPPGFTITTEACAEFYRRQRRWPPGLADEVEEHLRRLEAATGGRFGDRENPLLVSVRSGARVSMPGMMDTILNLGLNDQTVQGLAANSGDPRFAYDCYRRFLQMYGNVVRGIPHKRFEAEIEACKGRRGVKLDTELTAEDWQAVVATFKDLFATHTGEAFPQDPRAQLRGAIDAVFNSWNNPRARKYREIHGIPEDWGTAVNVMAMVFGNMGPDSGTGVAFTRNPATGEKEFYGEFLENAQGEDVVAGIRTPQPIAALRERLPQVYRQLEEIYQKLEAHYQDMQDIEFTVQRGRLYILQTRAGKRTARAAVRIAVDLAREGVIDRRTALLRIEPAQLDQLLHPTIAPDQPVEVIARGLPASPGAAVGRLVFRADDAEAWAARGEPVILVRRETSPEDIGGMHVAQGILTSTGGLTSHAAVVARGMGRCCVVGATEVHVDEEGRRLLANGHVLGEGDWITLNGSTGEVIIGRARLDRPAVTGAFSELLAWADDERRLGVRANADTPEDARIARDFGAGGIGLCRTEHMFFGEGRITPVRRMILARSPEERQEALEQLLPLQREDFAEILRVMEGLPVTIRLLDPPLHEFLPTEPEAIREVAREMGADEDEVRRAVAALREFNPMLGHRGCRLGITHPEIYTMQVRAIFEAACRLAREGRRVFPEVMIPLVSTEAEIGTLAALVRETAARVMEEAGVHLPVEVGTMIEVPRAVVVADRIARHVSFFSLGTNDLTQMTFGFSRDDAARFLPRYVEEGILAADPFQTLDREGVGALIRLATEKGRATRPDLKVGICGEHGGDPASIAFCEEAGLDYVSCSPFRVPVARLAAARARLA